MQHNSACSSQSYVMLRAEPGHYRAQNPSNVHTHTRTHTINKVWSVARKVAGRMLINWTGFECVWPCVGQKEPWDTETQQNWHWKQTEKKTREGATERSTEGRGGKYLISSRGRSVHIYSKKKHEKKVGWSRKEEREGMDGWWKDKRMDREAGFGEQES